MSGATPADAGLASGLVNTTVQVGGALGLAVVATLAATRTNHLLAHGASQASALTGGYQLAFIVGAGLILAALAVALTVLVPESSLVVQTHQETAKEHGSAEGEPAYSEIA
jgi:hypothetical protein